MVGRLIGWLQGRLTASESDDDSGEVAFSALVDIAKTELNGLGNPDIEDIDTAKAVLREIARSLPIRDLLIRIGYSAFPLELLAYTTNMRGGTVTDLKPIARHLYEVRRYFESDALWAFADVYWQAAQRAKREARDWSGAWHVTKMATLGEAALTDQVDWQLTPLIGGEPIGLLVSLDCGRRMVQDLHAAMCEAKLLPDVLVQPVPEGLSWGKDWPAGINVAREIGGYDPDGNPPLNALGLQALSIAQFACSKPAAANSELLLSNEILVPTTHG